MTFSCFFSIRNHSIERVSKVKRKKKKKKEGTFGIQQEFYRKNQSFVKNIRQTRFEIKALIRRTRTWNKETHAARSMTMNCLQKGFIEDILILSNLNEYEY
jgi:hypothetical protein